MPDLFFIEIHDRVKPVDYRGKLNEDDIGRMPLAHMYLLVDNYRVDLRQVFINDQYVKE